MTGHECTFPEVMLTEDVDEHLREGMRMLVPCSCGETPRDHLEIQARYVDDLTASLAAVAPERLLYHWAPVERRKQIVRYGLRPSMRATTSSEPFPVICLADSPSWAWALSGQMAWSPAREWDLWMTSLDRLNGVTILPSADRPSGMYEVRTTSRIYKRDLWLVGGRVKEPR